MIVVASVLPALFGVWFVERARLAARARAVAGIRLRALDRVAMAAPALRAAGLAALAGAVMGGWTTAALGAAGTLVVLRVRRRRADANRRAALDAQVPDVMRGIASALRAGRNVPQALDAAAEGAPAPIAEPLRAALARLAVGVPLPDAVEVFARAAGTARAREAAEAIRIGERAAALLPAVLDHAADAMDDRARIDRDRAAAGSQARLSAIVVGAMPVAFYALVGGGARRQLGLLFSDPVGWLLLGAGLGLDVAGVLWMRSMIRSRESR